MANILLSQEPTNNETWETQDEYYLIDDPSLNPSFNTFDMVSSSHTSIHPSTTSLRGRSSLSSSQKRMLKKSLKKRRGIGGMKTIEIVIVVAEIVCSIMVIGLLYLKKILDENNSDASDVRSNYNIIKLTYLFYIINDCIFRRITSGIRLQSTLLSS